MVLQVGIKSFNLTVIRLCFPLIGWKLNLSCIHATLFNGGRREQRVRAHFLVYQSKNLANFRSLSYLATEPLMCLETAEQGGKRPLEKSSWIPAVVCQLLQNKAGPEEVGVCSQPVTLSMFRKFATSLWWEHITARPRGRLMVQLHMCSRLLPCHILPGPAGRETRGVMQ